MRWLRTTLATQKRRRPRDASGTPGRTSIQPCKRELSSGKLGSSEIANQGQSIHLPKEWGSSRKIPNSRTCHVGSLCCTRGPWATQQGAALGSTKSTHCSEVYLCVYPPKQHVCHAKERGTHGRQRNPKGAYIQPLELVCHDGRQCTLSHTWCAKEAEIHGRQWTRRTYDPLAVRTFHTKETKIQWCLRNRGPYIRPLGGAHCPRLPCKRGEEQGTFVEHRGVHPTHCLYTLSHPWRCTVSHTCHDLSQWSKCMCGSLSAWVSE